MKILNKTVALILACLFAFSVCAVAFAGDTKDTQPVISQQAEENEGESADEDKTTHFDTIRAKNVALTSARSKFLMEGQSVEDAEKGIVTKVKYDKKNDAFKVTVRLNRKLKYTCAVAVIKFMDREIGYVADAQFSEHNAFSGFCGQLFEQFTYFFIRLFRGDQRKVG